MDENVISEFVRCKNWKHLGLLGRSSFGVVISVKDVAENRTLAVKLSKVRNKLETEAWPSLLHPSIVPLYEITETFHGYKAFVMPQFKISLASCLQGSSLVRRDDALNRIYRWLYEILCGLRFLHRLNLSHLDLRADNILLSYNDNAAISDFTYISDSSLVTCDHFLGMPTYWKPPELWDCTSTQEHAAALLDVWCYGLVTLETVTRCGLYKWVKRNCTPIPSFTFISDYIDTVLNEENYLESEMKKAFQTTDSLNNVKVLKNFAQLFLQEDPTKRISVEDAINYIALSPYNLVSGAQ